jgi:hypothetical protein
MENQQGCASDQCGLKELGLNQDRLDKFPGFEPPPARATSGSPSHTIQQARVLAARAVSAEQQQDPSVTNLHIKSFLVPIPSFQLFALVESLFNYSKSAAKQKQKRDAQTTPFTSAFSASPPPYPVQIRRYHSVLFLFSVRLVLEKCLVLALHDTGASPQNPGCRSQWGAKLVFKKLAVECLVFQHRRNCITQQNQTKKTVPFPSNMRSLLKLEIYQITVVSGEVNSRRPWFKIKNKGNQPAQ